MAEAQRLSEAAPNAESGAPFEASLEELEKVVKALEAGDLPLDRSLELFSRGMELSDTTGRVRIGIAIEEALLNAMYHGNLEISAEELADARANLLDGYLTRLIDERRSKLPFCNRKIVVGAHISTFGARFLIRDDGLGFNPATIYERPPAERFERGRSRGMTLMRSFMDQVTYNELGNQVILFKRPEPQAAGVGSEAKSVSAAGNIDR